MTKDELNPGDLVRLKSGGPDMTYEGEAAMLGGALCVWFRDRQLVRDRFEYSTLERAE